MGSSTTQIARGSTSNDEDGARTASVIFPVGTSAELILPNGSRKTLSQLSFRATEFTVGAEGVKRMPAALPATSAYTYAVELSSDEALAFGAKSVSFSKPVAFYVENFINLPVGVAVPVGIYDYEKGSWVPEKNGRVIKVLSLQNQQAVLDVDGTGAATAQKLTALGIDTEELKKIATTYSAGTSLWRVSLNHFSTVDLNFADGPGDDVTRPDVPEPRQDAKDPACNQRRPGSIIQVNTQTLGERVPIVGTPFTLNYTTDRAPGKKSNNTLQVNLTGASIRNKLKRVELTVNVAGQTYKKSFPAQANLITTFTWNGLDAYGRRVQGDVPAQVNLSYVYNATYLVPGKDQENAFARLGEGITLTEVPSRQEAYLERSYVSYVGVNSSSLKQALNGWTFDVHHSYDIGSKTLYLGNGFKRTADNIGRVITTVAGNGDVENSGDGGPATEAGFETVFSTSIDNQGNLYVTDVVGLVRMISKNGIVNTIAGTGVRGYSGDGGPAKKATA